MKTRGKSVRQWYRSLSFYKRLLMISIVVCALPLAVIQLLSMNVTIRHLSSQVDGLTRSNLNQISERFSLTLQAYTDIAYQIYADEMIVNGLREYHGAEPMEQAALFYSLNERLKQFAETKSGIRCISLICSTGESITYDNKTGSALDNIWRDYTDIRMIWPYRMIQGHSGVILLPTQQIWDNGEQVSLFFLGKEIYDSDDLASGAIATVVIAIREEVLREICSEDEEMSAYSVNFITDAEGKVVSFPEEGYIGRVVSGEQEACRMLRQAGLFGKKELVSNSYVDEESGWIFYNVYNKDYIMGTVRQVQGIYWLLLLVDVVIVIMFVNAARKSFSASLQKIMQGIRQVEDGNFDVSIDIDSADEIGQIGDHFNRMAQKIKSLLLEIEETLQKKKQAEIRALQSQINPHFLYNTLDAVNWMAIGKGEYEISSMLGNLGQILRYAMDQSGSMVLIYEEEKWLKSYMALYQLRYGNSFKFQIFVEPEVRSEKIYKLLLQPILENAILHGIRDVEDGYIRMNVCYTDDGTKLNLIVEDNGAGMDAELVDLYNQRAREDVPGERIGLANVFDRIRLYYGNQGSWHISSVKGKGTIVEILVPCITEEDEEKVI